MSACHGSMSDKPCCQCRCHVAPDGVISWAEYQVRILADGMSCKCQLRMVQGDMGKACSEVGCVFR
jgi:hypothetical protein